MLVECRARRDKRDIRIGRKDRDLGTKVKLFGRIYHFRPQPDLVPEGLDPAAHICEVSDERAIVRFVTELPEQFNELGKPPRIPQPDQAEASGQPEVVVELLDEDDVLGEKDAREVDPLASARRLQQEWIGAMLAQSVTKVAKDLPRYDADEIDLLIQAERKGKNRRTMIEALLAAQEQAVEAKQAVPQLPPDDIDQSMNLE